jgi:3-oxoacyl-(acyl-carrier-protein) synthase III
LRRARALEGREGLRRRCDETEYVGRCDIDRAAQALAGLKLTVERRRDELIGDELFVHYPGGPVLRVSFNGDGYVAEENAEIAQIDRKLFADGAGAVILEGHEEGVPARGLLSHHLHSDGSAIDALYGEIWGSSTFPLVSKKKIDDDRARPRMNGRSVFVNAVKRVKEIVQESLDANGLKAEDIGFFVFHQANIRIIEVMAEAFAIPESKMLNNIQRYGNTAGASVPICLHEAVMAGRVKDNDLVMLVAFGTGFSWGATLLRW